MKQLKLGLVSFVLLLSACMPIQPRMTSPATATIAATTPTGAENSLVNIQWQLVSWGVLGAEAPVIASNITLEFMADGRAAGISGCNVYNGTYVLQNNVAQNNTLAFGEMISTLKGCGDEQTMQTEQEYLAALTTAGEFIVTGNQLTIQYADGTRVLNFIRAEATTTNLGTQPTVQFKLDHAVALSFTRQTIPLSPPKRDVPFWGIYPEHTQITLMSYDLTDTVQAPQIFIYPAEAYATMNEAAAPQIAALQALLKERPSGPVDHRLPVLPTFNAAQVFNAQFKSIDFANGTGVRFLTQYDQAVTPINNHEMFYTFQGLTADHAYYVAAIFPVTYPELPADNSALPPDFMDHFDRYLATTMQTLNDADAARFTPDLAQLDALIASLSIQATH